MLCVFVPYAYCIKDGYIVFLFRFIFIIIAFNYSIMYFLDDGKIQK
jgi:hypothetical protein